MIVAENAQRLAEEGKAPSAPQPAPRRWPIIGLSTKVAVLVIVGTVSMIGLFAYLGTASLSENTERNLQERVILAQMSASYIDALLDNIENVLTHAASEEKWSNPASIETALDENYHRLSFFASRVFFVDAAGRSVAAQPPIRETILFNDITPVSAVLSGAPFSVSHLAQPLGSMGPSVVAASPVRDAGGKVTGALAIKLDFSSPNIRAFSNPIGLGQSGYMDLVAIDGRILASTRAGRIGSESDHGYSLSGMIRDHRQSVSACHDCHTAPTEAEPRAEVLAFAPLERAQWGITVRQSESEVFASTSLLQGRIFELMVIMLGGALVLVYLATRSVIVPVQALTAATRRIAAGDMDSPIKPMGRDEVGVLAQSFDEMRRRLKKSNEEIQAWNRELDARVQERTAAYEAAAKDNARLYTELQLKEKLRGELLHRVISVQEDERKRIARELHDETSQSLTALMVGLDTIQIALVHDIQKANAHLRNCNTIAGSLLKNIHRLIADLRPTLLDDLGLVPAIAWYGEQRLKPLGITLQMDESCLKGRLPASVETALFRIVQEAMTNIVRHAKASVVTVEFEQKDGWVTLQIADNGQGFDPQSLESDDPHGKGLGLGGMEERTTILGGVFKLQSASGKGTTITVRVPS
jgi:signal transduction histidine kinase